MTSEIKMEFLKQGYLYHLGGFMKSWSDRYFVLTANELSIFEDSNMKSKIAALPLESIGTVAMQPNSEGKKNCFQITTTSESYLISAESPAERESWSKAILAAKNGNAIAENQKMVYSIVNQEWTTDKAEEYYIHLGTRLMQANNTDTIREAYFCIASWTSRTYNENTIPNLPTDLVRQILDGLLRTSNLKKSQAQKNNLWNDDINISFLEVSSTISYVNYLILKHKLSNVQMADLANPLARGIPISGFYQKYKKKATLGSGAFGEVYECEHVDSKKRFAAKIMQKKKMSADDIRYLDIEVKCMAMIVHPDFVYLEQFFETATEFIIVMEIANGVSLRDEAMNHKDWGEVDVLNIMKKLTGCVKYLHSIGLAHRDLKPENVLFTHTGQMKLADFGFAKKIEEGLTTSCGSPLYMAPEILEGGPYTEKCDEWSLGVVMYELLCGFTPFSDQNQDRLFKKIKSGVINFPSPYWDYVSDYGKELVEKLIKLDPKKRITAAKSLEHKWFKEGEKLMKKEQKSKQLFKTFKDSANKVLKRGYVNKSGTKLPTWKKRSFALYSDKLVSFESETSTTPKGVFMLNTVKSIIPKASNVFSLSFTVGKDIQLQFDTDEDANTWKDSILSARRCWSLLDLATKAYNNGRMSDALDCLQECRQNQHMYQHPDVVNLWRYIAWKCKKISCASIWSLNSVFLHHAHIDCMTSFYLGDEEMVVCGCSEGSIQVVSLTSNFKNKIDCHEGSDVVAIGVQLSTGTMVTGASNGSLCFWDIFGMKLFEQKPSTSYPVLSVVGCQTQPIYLTLYSKIGCEIWDSVERKSIKMIKDAKGSVSLAVTRNYFALGGRKKVYVYDLKNYTQVTFIKGHDQSVSCICPIPHSDFIVTGGEDRKLFVWNLAEQKIVQKLKANKTVASTVEHSEVIRSIDVSNDGRWCISSAEDGKIVLWNIETGETEAVALIMDGYIKSVKFSSDYCSIISAKSRYIENWFVDWVLENNKREFTPPSWVVLN